MSDRQLSQLIALRVQQAQQALRSAAILLDSNDIQGSVNRSYYAMFYVLSALLETRQLATSKHSGAIGLFDREFVKTGDFDKALSRRLHRAFEFRQASDYSPTVTVSYEQASELQQDAIEFVEALQHYLDTK